MKVIHTFPPQRAPTNSQQTVPEDHGQHQLLFATSLGVPTIAEDELPTHASSSPHLAPAVRIPRRRSTAEHVAVGDPGPSYWGEIEIFSPLRTPKLREGEIDG